MKILFLIILIPFYFLSSGQKVYTLKNTDKGGTNIDIVIESNGKIHKYGPSCGFKDVTLLPDSTKIRLIGELLAFTTDTSMYYIPVNDWTNHYMGKKWPMSKRYNTQLSALFIINYVAFSSKAFVYCPFPVLYDSLLDKELTQSCDALNDIIVLYKKWYEDIKANGFTNYSLPLIGGRYKWFGSLMGNITFRKYPKWEDYYSCRVLD